MPNGARGAWRTGWVNGRGRGGPAFPWHDCTGMPPLLRMMDGTPTQFGDHKGGLGTPEIQINQSSVHSPFQVNDGTHPSQFPPSPRQRAAGCN